VRCSEDSSRERKQDRVIGKDRIVPAESDPIDLSVFLRRARTLDRHQPEFRNIRNDVRARLWGGIGAVAGGTLMAQPSVRSKAMADKNQNEFGMLSTSSARA